MNSTSHSSKSQSSQNHKSSSLDPPQPSPKPQPSIDHTSHSPKTKRFSLRLSKYVIIGLILTVINFSIYTFLDRIIFKNSDLLWLVSLISCTITTIFGYLLHSNITWRERDPGRAGAIKFLAWNLFTAIAVSPFCTWVFGFITPLYEFAYMISSNLHLPFDYNFVEATGIFCLTSFIVMILNFLFYDRIVFKKQKPENPTS